MRTTVLCILGLTLLAMAQSEQSVFRTRRSILQSIAVDRMLRDRGFVMSVIDCVLDKGPCDKHGRNLKRKSFLCFKYLVARNNGLNWVVVSCASTGSQAFFS